MSSRRLGLSETVRIERDGGRYFPTHGSQIMFCRLRFGSDVTENSENQRMSVPTTRARDEVQTREDTPLQNEIINNAVLLNLVQFTLFIIFY